MLGLFPRRSLGITHDLYDTLVNTAILILPQRGCYIMFCALTLPVLQFRTQADTEPTPLPLLFPLSLHLPPPLSLHLPLPSESTCVRYLAIHLPVLFHPASSGFPSSISPLPPHLQVTHGIRLHSVDMKQIQAPTLESTRA